MKQFLLLIILLVATASSYSQVFTPVQKANFGVDGELRSNMFGIPPAPGTDDWFNNSTGSGQYVIDVTDAATILARYSWDAAFRRYPFYRTMRFPPYSTVNNKLLIDAVFIRDYHGDDTTAFVGSNKNADSPQSWAADATSVPDKNDILDMMVHVRRAGPTVTDSLWLFGGLSVDNVTGSRYFDFEMYQTDIYYDRPSKRFYGYGPDLGHTSWRFDASGNITVPGDIIFTAEYGGSGLTALEARIWVNRDDLAITPADFSWSGQFDGATASSQYGYASIMPNSSGAYYTGVQNNVSTWPGPFGLILANNTLATSYIAKQFMEFSVNLTKLGLDPVTLLGGNACGMPFRRVLVKTRSSASFSAELKDFVGPFDLFLAPRATAAADVTLYCGTYGVSNLQVTNPVSTSTYTWTTTDGNIVGSNVGPTVTANMPGTYVVSQQLQSSCLVYATDTVLITYAADCNLLENNLTGLTVAGLNDDAQLKWTVLRNSEISYFNIEYSLDGIHFTNAGTIAANDELTSSARYSFNHNISLLPGNTIYYRVVMFGSKGSRKDSKIVKLVIPTRDNVSVTVTPNPVVKSMQVNVNLQAKQVVELMIYDIAGHILYDLKKELNAGLNTITIDGADKWPTGVYTVKVISANKVLTEKVIIH